MYVCEGRYTLQVLHVHELVYCWLKVRSDSTNIDPSNPLNIQPTSFVQNPSSPLPPFPFPSLLTFFHSPFLSSSSNIPSPSLSLLFLPSFLSSFPLSPQTIYRARFSSITEQAILHAFHNLAAPNWNEARSVDARMELDLRIGCSFTRFQTTLFQVFRKQIHFISFKLCRGPSGSVV